ncbi:MAG: TetR/AcrR family transcriptional regulator [Acidobacteriota bacterium]|nr:TetR/AcrR family transcriptional regulator [Acidobacteriota bacterium]
MPSDTRDQILDTAERLFAEFGIDGVSIRTITAEARVNLAAIHYHFGSKEALVREVFVRRIDPLNRERLRLLDDLLERSLPQKPKLEELVRILVGPPLRLWLQAGKGETFTRLCGRIYSESSGQLETMFVDLFQEVVRRFSAAFEQAAPELPKTELMWRMHFVIGAMVHTLMQVGFVRQLRAETSEGNEVEANIERLTRFATAGLRAPLPQAEIPATVGKGEREALG